MVLFQKINLGVAVEFLFLRSCLRQAIGSSVTHEYNKFAGGKYKGRDSDDPRHVFANSQNIQYY
jgi:hypothetical protein